MSSLENEIKDLRESNNELVQKVQFWKMTAAQRENEKLELMKELNDLRLKLSRMRSGGAAQARKLDAALQAASEEALSHLVQASNAVAQTVEFAKTYMRDRQELYNETPRWSSISANSNTDRVHRVPPMMLGGLSIQPVVSLSRTVMNTSNPRSNTPSQNRNITERAVPIHMLQDVYIPLTRIDAFDLPGNNVETNETSNIEDSTNDLGLEDSNERSLEESHNVTEEDFQTYGRLDAVAEDLEPEDEVATATAPARSRTENPLEGPSWLLDIPNNSKQSPGTVIRSNLEPDSTTELDETNAKESPVAAAVASVNASPAVQFSPTVRRRKRTASPPPDISPSPIRSPLLPHKLHSNNSRRVLKVMVAKMQVVGEEAAAASSARTPPRSRRKHMRFDAPSPNGSTDAAVIVSEAVQQPTVINAGGDSDVTDDAPIMDGDVKTSRRRNTSRDTSRETRSESASSGDSAAGPTEGRSRRVKKPIIYKEKPLNRKLRR